MCIGPRPWPDGYTSFTGSTISRTTCAVARTMSVQGAPRQGRAQSADCKGSSPEEGCTTKEIRSAEVNVLSRRELGHWARALSSVRPSDIDPSDPEPRRSSKSAACASGCYAGLTVRIRLLTALPARNRTALLAAIWMASPVCGFRPSRAGRAATSKEPRPGTRTASPATRASRMAFTTAFTAWPTAAWFSSVA